MKKAQSDYITLSYRKFVLMTACIIVALVTFIFFAATTYSTEADPSISLNYNRARPTSILIPTPTLTPHSYGFHGYSDYGRWFDLDLPPECTYVKEKEYRFEDPKTITCNTRDFTVIIYPQTGGRETNTIETKQITLNNTPWTKFLLDEPNLSAIYQLEMNTPGNNYLLSVKYEPFTPEAEHYFETILASFHFID
jgi:hypothetical protein